MQRNRNLVKAINSNVRSSPRKIGLLLKLIRGKKVDMAIRDLSFARQRIAIDIKKLVQSAVANAENNFQHDIDNLYIKEAYTGKSIVLNYKIDRGSKFRVGQFIVNGSTSNVSYDDTFNESNGDAGITLSAVLDNKDSTAGNETVIVKYTTTNLVDATMDVEVLQLI